MPERKMGDSAEAQIYRRIFDRICTVLDDSRIGTLRGMLHSVISEQDLTAFCTDPMHLTLVDRHSGGKGIVRAFRSSLFCVRLKVFAETARSDADVQRVRIMVDIQDGGNSGSRALAEWRAATDEENQGKEV